MDNKTRYAYIILAWKLLGKLLLRIPRRLESTSKWIFGCEVWTWGEPQNIRIRGYETSVLTTIPNTEYKKVKVKMSLCLTKHHVMKTYWGSEGTAPLIL
jgi:hypothetical protein